MIPKKVKILGNVYLVDIFDEKDTLNDNLGTHWKRYRRIHLNKHSDYQCQESTLLHEIIEAINAVLEMGLKHKDRKSVV